MEQGLYDLLDTGLKIGLGAAISGLSAYFLTRKNHAQVKEKESRDRKISLLHETSVKIEQAKHKLDQATHPYWEVIAESRENYDAEETKRALASYLEASSLIGESQATLTLLSFVDAAKHLKKASDHVGVLYQSMAAAHHSNKDIAQFNHMEVNVRDELNKCMTKMAVAYAAV